jgi:hypothetical protein
LNAATPAARASLYKSLDSVFVLFHNATLFGGIKRSGPAVVPTYVQQKIAIKLPQKYRYLYKKSCAKILQGIKFKMLKIFVKYMT